MHYYRQRSSNHAVNDGRSIALDMLDAGWLVKHHPGPCIMWAERTFNALSRSSGENPFQRNHQEGEEDRTKLTKTLETLASELRKNRGRNQFVT